MEHNAAPLDPAQLRDPEPGDLILQESEYVHHTILWVDSTKPKRCIAESSYGNMFGVRLSGVTNFQFPKHLDDLRFSTVFRWYREPAVARTAADFAIRWATSTDDESPIHRERYRALLDKQSAQYTLRTPYGGPRAAKGGDITTAEGLFRAVRAWARVLSGFPLSHNKGVGCAAFATYCYQIAALEVLVGQNELKAFLDSATRYVKIKQELNVAWVNRMEKAVGKDYAALNDAPKRAAAIPGLVATAREAKASSIEEFQRQIKRLDAQWAQRIAAAFQREARSNTTENLYKQLITDTTNFRRVGFLVGNGATKSETTRVKIVASEAAPPNDAAFPEFARHLRSSLALI